MHSFWERKTFSLITGASRGIGEGFAHVFASKSAPGSVLVLASRDGEKMKSVKLKIDGRRADLKVFLWITDLQTADEQFFKLRFEKLFKENDLKASDFEQCLLVHNANVTGNAALKLTEQRDKKHIDDFWSLNMTSTLILTSIFVEIFNKTATRHRYILQMSSVVAKKFLNSAGLYCAGKVARDALFEIMASEEPDMRFLSYAPGVVLTDLARQLTFELSIGTKQDIADIFKGLENPVITAEQSAEKLAEILERDNFKSGSHVDYYEVDEGDGGKKLPLQANFS